MTAQENPKWQRQLDLEQEMTSAGIARYDRNAESARTKGQETALPPGQRMLIAAVEPTTKAIETYLTDARSGRPGRAAAASTLLEGLDPRVVAYITARVILDKIGGSSMLQSVALSVASSVEDEARFMCFEQQDPEKYKLTEKNLEGASHLRYRKRVTIYQMNRAGVAWKDWPETSKVQLGVRLVELFTEATGLVAIEVQDRGRYRVTATQVTLKWLEESNARHALLCPVYLPCLIPPKPWTTPLSGGYHTGAVRRLSLVKTRSKGFLDELFNSDLSQVYSAINALQDTAWVVNRRVLDVARLMWDNGLGLGKVLPSRDGADVPAKPGWLTKHGKDTKLPDLTEEQKEEFKAWKSVAAEAHKKFAKSVSRRLQASRIIGVAERFAPEEEIYFPYTSDFRGRVYAQPPFLNPQGHDLAKGMLTFAHGKPIGDTTGPGWLAIHGANVYGYDKASLDDRVAWVEEHQQAILACANDPLACAFWQDADSPWSFLAFCFEWEGYVASGASHVSSLPIALDGSCNGIQHFSAMLRDPVGGAAVNLVPSDRPSDIYASVSAVATAKLCLIHSTGGEDADMAKAWMGFGLDRKITKRSVMVLPYGGTYMSCKQYVEEAVLDRDAPFPGSGDRKTASKAIHFLAKIVWQSIGEVVIGARECMAWLQACARLASKTELPINWPVASGLWVQQAYKTTKLKQVKVRLYNEQVNLKIAVDGAGLDASRQVMGVAPNFVHSMDAAALIKCVNISVENGIKSFAMIHDSYGTLAADTDVLGACLRHAFVDLYKEHDVLEEFRKGIVAMLPPELADKVPPCPVKGSLDLDAVLSSDFFFA